MAIATKRALVALLSTGSVSAFLAPFQNNAFPMTRVNLQPSNTDMSRILPHYPSLLMSVADDLVPHPPEYPPMIDQQLEEDLIEAERRVMLYEKEVELLREKMSLKEEELQEEQNEWREERMSLMDRIAQFTNTLAQRDKELAAVTAAQSEKPKIDPERVEGLEIEIQSLKVELSEKAGALAKEREATAEIRKRFEDANDALEFEQNNFEKERKTLQRLLDDERNRYQELESKSKQDSKSYERSRSELIDRVKIEEEKVRDTKAKWSEAQRKLDEVQGRLNTELQEKTKSLEDREITFAKQVARLSGDKASLQEQLQSQQEQLIQVQKELVEEQASYERRKRELEQKMGVLSSSLKSVEKDLENERVVFSKEKMQLEKNLKNEIRVGRLKKRQMKERYDEIRREMTSLWEDSKRQARREENRLRRKYKNKINSLNGQVALLECDLATSRMEARAALASKMEQVELRDASIEELRVNVSNLNQIIVERDTIIQEQSAKIDRYESSLRSVVKLGFTVTGKKLRRVGRPFKRLVQRSRATPTPSSTPPLPNREVPAQALQRDFE